MHIIKKKHVKKVSYIHLWMRAFFSWFLSDVKKWFELNLKLLHIGKIGGVWGIS